MNNARFSGMWLLTLVSPNGLAILRRESKAKRRIANSEGGKKITEGTEKEKGVGIQYDLRSTTCRGAIFDTKNT